jgi:uncharacterized protein (UPF0212 family)
MLDSFVLAEYGLEMEELEEIMANVGYERCPECESWCETGELVDEEGDPCSCSWCR